MSMADARPTRVFISYSRRDAAEAQAIAEDLRMRGFEVLLDVESILPGEQWRDRLSAMIGRSDALLYLISENSVESEICGFEIAHAAELKKRLIPVQIGALDAAAAPPDVARLNFIFARDVAERAAAIPTIAAAVETDIDWVREHTRLGEAARRWQAQGQPGASLLRGSDLQEAERWLAGAPGPKPGAPAPTALERAYLKVSREGARGRKRWLAAAAIGALILVGGGLFVIDAQDRAARRKAHDYTVAQALTAVERLEDRLDVIDVAMADFFTPLEVPELKGVAEWSFRGARRRVAKEIANQMRQKLNGLPLPLSGEGEARRLYTEADADPAQVEAFYQALHEAQDGAESLFTALDTAASDACADAPGADLYREERVKLQMRALLLDSKEAYHRALDLLRGVGAEPERMAPTLARLRLLEPNEPPQTDAEAQALQRRMLEEREGLVADLAMMRQIGRQVGEACQKGLVAQVEDDLTVKPDDPPHVILGKARSLRQFGRPQDAVRAFEQFAERFPDLFPEGMDAYLQAAKDFTRDVVDPESSGGLYVAQVDPGGAAEEAGLRVGDIILAINGQPVPSTDLYLKILADTPEGGRIALQIVRRSAEAEGRYVGQGLLFRTAATTGMLVRPI